MKKLILLIFSTFLLLNPVFAAYENLYVVGNACEIGWNPDAALPMTKEGNGIFTWTGTLIDNSIDQARFKFLVSDQWKPSLTCRINVNGHLVIEPGQEYDLYERPNPEDGMGYDNAFQVTSTGVYKLEVNLNTMKLKCTKVSDITRKNWEYVKPELGAQGEGHVFPGVCVPFGMVKLGADCGDKNDNSGWNSGGRIHGFSHVHVSGTGGGPKYGNILLQPLTGDLNLTDYSSDRSNEKFALGLYEVSLNKYNVDVRLTASHKAGFHEYTFPESSSSKLLIDAGSCLTLHIESQELVASGVKVLSDTEIEGYSTVKGGWNMGGPYTVYFYAQTDTPSEGFSTWKGTTLLPDNQVDATGTEKTGVYLRFNTTAEQKVKVKVGISFISTQRAKENISELPSWEFDDIRNAAIAKWENVLNRVNVEGTDNDKTIFYTAIHHAFLQPTDRTGENPLWESTEPYFDDFYAIWDTFRATHPLFALISPSRQADMVRSMIDIYKNEGYMPDARSGNSNGRVQGGSNCDVLIADAIVKNLTGIDYEKGLAAMIKNAEVEPENPRQEGRGGISDYNTKGYVSTAFERSGTRTFEYAYCDYAIATVAKALGKEDIYQKYLRRSNNWKNLWNDNIESLGYKGFLWPRKSNGDWVNQNDYDVFRGGGWEGVIYESYPWEMSFYAPHDMDGLIARCGGKEMFLKRLDTYFTHAEKFDQNHYIGLFQVSNEPGFLVPTLYNYVNRPDKTAEIVRRVLSTKYSTQPWGLPGNDDSGSMSAWYAFHAMGFFPNAGQDVYLISSPVFTKTTIKLENGKTFEILAPETNATNIYVQSVKLNGEPLNRCWLKHEEIINGGTLEFVMGDKPSDWAFDGEKLPSSPVGIDEVSSEIESPKVRIHSYSGQVNQNESAYNLFADPSQYIKWCDNKSTEPWVIFELADTYLLDRFVFRDSKTVEGNNNVHEYRIHTSNKGVEDGDWEEVVYRNDGDDANIKDDRLTEPKEARFVKFSMKMPKAEDAIRIYGFDLYGKLKERTDRDKLVSVGKTFLKSSGSNSYYSNPRHILDGLTNNEEYQWVFNKDIADKHYCILDLEDEYEINSFKIYDSNNVTGYNVYISTEAPDLNEITNSSDNNSLWHQVISGELNKAVKEKQIDKVKARYIKLEIPQANIDSESAAITEFEIYKDNTSSVKTADCKSIELYPNPVKQGNPFYITGNGHVEIFSAEGMKVYSKAVSEKTLVNTSHFIPGIYIVSFSDKAGKQMKKLVVE